VYATKRLIVLIVCGFCIIFIAMFSKQTYPPPQLPGDSVGVGDNVFELSVGWNMISMPEITAKESVYVRYDNVEYTWSEAAQIPLIVDDLKGYDGSTYFSADTFLPYRGYWVYSFVEPLNIYLNSSTVICGRITFNSSSDLNITCDTLIITEFSNVNITCNTLNPAIVNLKYAGIPLP